MREGHKKARRIVVRHPVGRTRRPLIATIPVDVDLGIVEEFHVPISRMAFSRVLVVIIMNRV